MIGFGLYCFVLLQADFLLRIYFVLKFDMPEQLQLRFEYLLHYLCMQEFQ